MAINIIQSLQSGNFSDNSTWVGNIVPARQQVARIVSPHTVTLDNNASIGEGGDVEAIIVDSGATLTQAAGTTVTIVAKGYIQVEGLFTNSSATQLIITDGGWVVTVAGGYQIRIELRDTSSVLQHVWIKEVQSCNWEYQRNGGCSNCNVEIRADIEDYTLTSLLGYDLRVILEPSTGPATWWRGYIIDAGHSLADKDTLRVTAVGWAERLERISVVGLGFEEEDGGVVFDTAGQYASDIVKSLLDRSSPWTGITYDGTSIPNSTATVNHITFNSSILNAIKRLAEINGMGEYAVDRNKKFWFKNKSVTTSHIFVPGKNVSRYEISSSIQGMLNRIYLIGDDNYTITLESSSDLVADQQQTTNTSTLNFGMSTTYQKALQTFTPTEASLSAIEVAVAKINFTSNLCTDGDMEAGDLNAWNILTTYTKPLTKDTYIYHGISGQSLRVNKKSGANRFGVYHDNITVVAGSTYRFSGWARPAYGEVIIIELVDGSASSWSNTVLAQQQTTITGGWQQLTMVTSPVPAGTILGIRAYAYNTGSGTDHFWVDDFSLVLAGANVEVALMRDDGAGTWVEITSYEISFDDIPDTTPIAFSKSLIVPYIDLDNLATRPYAIQIQTLGDLSDSTYFVLGINAAGGYAGGTLKYYDGASWIDTGDDAYFKTKLPASQQTWGVYSEVMRVSGIDNDEDAQNWADSVIAAKQSPITRGTVGSDNWTDMLEDNLPLDLLRIQEFMTSGVSIERITYTHTDGKELSIEVEFGAILPRISDALAWIEQRLDEQKIN